MLTPITGEVVMSTKPLPNSLLILSSKLRPDIFDPPVLHILNVYDASTFPASPLTAGFAILLSCFDKSIFPGIIIGVGSSGVPPSGLSVVISSERS